MIAGGDDDEAVVAVRGGPGACLVGVAGRVEGRVADVDAAIELVSARPEISSSAFLPVRRKTPEISMRWPGLRRAGGRPRQSAALAGQHDDAVCMRIVSAGRRVTTLANSTKPRVSSDGSLPSEGSWLAASCSSRRLLPTFLVPTLWRNRASAHTNRFDSGCDRSFAISATGCPGNFTALRNTRAWNSGYGTRQIATSTCTTPRSL